MRFPVHADGLEPTLRRWRQHANLKNAELKRHRFATGPAEARRRKSMVARKRVRQRERRALAAVC